MTQPNKPQLNIPNHDCGLISLSDRGLLFLASISQYVWRPLRFVADYCRNGQCIKECALQWSISEPGGQADLLCFLQALATHPCSEQLMVCWDRKVARIIRIGSWWWVGNIFTNVYVPWSSEMSRTRSLLWWRWATNWFVYSFGSSHITYLALWWSDLVNGSARCQL